MFSQDQGDEDARAASNRLRAHEAFQSQEPGELDGAVEELIEKNLDPENHDWSEVTRRVMRGVVESIHDPVDADWAIRRASQKAVLAVARRWGNVVLAGKATVSATQEAACKNGLDIVRAAQQAGLGAIDGIRQVGPVAYPVLQQELTPMVQDFQEVLEEERRSGEWMFRSLERSAVELPVCPRLLPQEAPESLNLQASDYEEVALEVEESDLPLVELPSPIQAPAPVEPTLRPQPASSWWQKTLQWVKSLFRGREKVARQ